MFDQEIKWCLPMNSFKKFISIDEKEMTPAQEKRREDIVLSLKKKKDEFKERYGSEWEDVMYATATKMAMKGEETELDEMVYDVGAKPRFGFKTGDSTNIPLSKRGKSVYSWRQPNPQRMDDGLLSDKQLKFLRQDFERFEKFGPKTHKLYKQIIAWLFRQEKEVLVQLAELEPRIRWLSHYAYNRLVSTRVKVKSKIFGLDEKIRMLNYGEDITYVVDKKTRKVVMGPIHIQKAKEFVKKNGGGWKYTILDRPKKDKKVGDKIGVLEQRQTETESIEMEENYDNMLKWYETSNEKKVYAILDKNNIKLPAEGFTLVQNMLKKHRDNVKKAADEIMNKHYPHLKESVDELDEAWDAEGVIRNAEIGSKKGYGINIKKTGGVTKTPYKHMLMTMRRDKSVRVTFDFGKDEFEGTPESVATYINKLLGIKESVDELDEARNDTITMTFEFPDNRKAKKFAYDISNSLIATGEVIGNKVEVEPFDYERKTQQALAKYMKKNGGELIDEDAPANSAGSGAVSGFTPDTVGVSKKKQKKHKKQVRKQLGDILMSKNEETKTYRTFMEGLEKNIRSWNSGNDRIMVREKDGHPVFIVSVDEFAKCKSKRKKFERWSRFFDSKSASGRKIKEYSHKNPSKPIVLQCSQTGELIYLRRRLNDSRLRHNNKKSGLTND